MQKIIVNIENNGTYVEYSGKLSSRLAGILAQMCINTNEGYKLKKNVYNQFIDSVSKYDVTINDSKTQEHNFITKTKCFPHQVESIEYGLEHDKFILGDEQGLGKTKSAIDLAVNLKHQGKIKRCLIICGINGNKYNWEEEVAIHSNEKCWVLGTRYRKNGNRYEGSGKDKLDDLSKLPEHFFLVTNIETMRALAKNEGTAKRRKMVFPIAEKIAELCDNNEIGMIVFDECQMAKNPDSQQGKAMLKISANHMLAMSGTPIMNNPLEAYFPLKWLGFETHSFYQFKNHYCIMGGFHNSEIRGYKNLSELRQAFEDVMLRRTKKGVLNLPPKIHSKEYVIMDKEQQKLYDDVLTGIKEDIDKIRLHPDPLSQMIRLRQTTGYPGILSSTIKSSSKLLRCEEMVRDEVKNGGKVIIFSQWKQMTDEVVNVLKDLRPLYINGDVKTEDRMKSVNAFQNDDDFKVIVGTIGAMGTGLTLNAANTVIFLDEPWNRALKDQAEDRAHRIGTKGTVNIITLITKDTIDERINTLVANKGAMADMLVDGVRKSGHISLADYLIS